LQQLYHEVGFPLISWCKIGLSWFKIGLELFARGRGSNFYILMFLFCAWCQRWKLVGNSFFYFSLACKLQKNLWFLSRKLGPKPKSNYLDSELVAVLKVNLKMIRNYCNLVLSAFVLTFSPHKRGYLLTCTFNLLEIKTGTYLTRKELRFWVKVKSEVESRNEQKWSRFNFCDILLFRINYTHFTETWNRKVQR